MCWLVHRNHETISLPVGEEGDEVGTIPPFKQILKSIGPFQTAQGYSLECVPHICARLRVAIDTEAWAELSCALLSEARRVHAALVDPMGPVALVAPLAPVALPVAPLALVAPAPVLPTAATYKRKWRTAYLANHSKAKKISRLEVLVAKQSQQIRDLKIALNNTNLKRGKHNRYFSDKGGLTLAIRSAISHTGSQGVGMMMGLDVHGVTVRRWKVTRRNVCMFCMLLCYFMFSFCCIGIYSILCIVGSIGHIRKKYITSRRACALQGLSFTW
jgi:hypothetical protein